MIFDRACGIVERHLPELVDTFHQAKLFVFPVIPHLFLKEHCGHVTKEALDLFTLPFPVTAIEDNASCVMLVDFDDNAIGAHHMRSYINIGWVGKDINAFNTNPKEKEMVAELKKHFPSDTVILDFGTIYNISHVNKTACGIQAKSGRFIIASKNEVFVDYKDNMPRELVDASAVNVLAAIEELLLLNTPKRFVVESTPNKLPKKKKIARSHQRPNYTLLTISDTLRKLGNEHSITSSKTPHFRRRHLRRLTKESGYKEDKIIVVKACWIGNQEKVTDNKTYKVRLDL